MDTTAGYIYILVNASLNGIVKIGKTQNTPDERAKELSSAAGVPTPFIVAYSSYFKDCDAGEVFVYTRLENNRLADNKEFFQVSVQQAIEAVREAESSLGVIPEPTTNKDLKFLQMATKPLSTWKVVFHSASAYSYGLGDTIEDKSEALNLYIKSANLGSIPAYWIIGRMYLNGQGCKPDVEKARSTFKDGTKVGNDLCWAGLAEIFFHEGQEDNWNKSWDQYFNSPSFIEKKQFVEYMNLDAIMSNRAYQIYTYGEQATYKKWRLSHVQLIQANENEILKFSNLYGYYLPHYSHPQTSSSSVNFDKERFEATTQKSIQTGKQGDNTNTNNYIDRTVAQSGTRALVQGLFKKG
jgi:TPR repeat protein